jgi:glutamate-5-semialdehyde dehydrogenase
MSTRELAQLAKIAAVQLPACTEANRQKALRAIAVALRTGTDDLMAENFKDVTAARAAGLGSALIDRLALGVKQIEAMARACEEIATAPQVVGMIVEEQKRSDGLLIQKQRIPLGVIGMIFESRPNVVIDGAALAIKSGNAIILKGGKEAQHSNAWLAKAVAKSIQGILPNNSVTLIETREEVTELLKLREYIDLMVPRGGEKLIKYVRENATMPVVAHDRGLCHLYIHSDADVAQVQTVVLNAKVQRPSACNAMETLLVHKDFPVDALIATLTALRQQNVEIHGCPRSQKLLAGIQSAQEADYDTEWLDYKMSLKIVDSADEALKHIQQHGTQHTEAVLTKNPQVIEQFLNGIDASCLAINASTRFNDGGELGLGAELGISTSKLHAYGPMGAKEMTSTRFIVRGSGHVRI